MNFIKIKTSLFFLLILSTVTLQAQDLGYEWGSVHGSAQNDLVGSVMHDAAGSAITIGTFSNAVDFNPDPAVNYQLTSQGGTDIFVQKLDVNGNFQWAIRIGGTGDESGLDVAIDQTSGDVFIVGTYQGNVTVPRANPQPPASLTSAGGNDILIARLDGTNGDVLWVEDEGGAGEEYSQAIAFHDNNLYLAGYFGNFGAVSDLEPGVGVTNFTSQANFDIFIQRLDAANGTFGANGWTRTLSSTRGTPSISHRAKDIAVDNGGDILIGGDFGFQMNFDPNGTVANPHAVQSNGLGTDGFLLKLDNASNFVWVETFVGGTNNVLESVVHDPIYDRIYVGGKYPDSIKINGAAQPVANGTADIYIARLNDDQSGPNGRPSYDWVKTFNGTDRNYVRAMDVDATGDHLYLTGDFRGDTDFGNGTVSSINIQDLYILKLDASNHAFVRLDHTNSGSGEAIDVDAEDVVYLGGTFLAGTDFNFQPVNAAILVNAGLEDGFTVKYEPCNATTTTETVVACDDFTWIDGNTYTSSTTQTFTPINIVGCDQTFNLNLTIITTSQTTSSTTSGPQDLGYEWGSVHGSAQNDLVGSVMHDAAGSAITIGTFSNAVDFNPDPAVNYQLTSQGGTDIFVQKLDVNGNFQWAIRIGGTGDESGLDVAIDQTSGDVFIVGTYQGNVTVPRANPQPPASLTSAGGNDILIARLDGTNGDVLWVEDEGGAGEEYSQAIAFHDNNLYLAGYFGNFGAVSDLEPGVGVTNFTSQANFDIFIQRLDAANGTFGANGWTRTLSSTRGTPSISHRAKDIAVDNGGDILIGGDFGFQMNFDPNGTVANPHAVQSNGLGTDGFLLKLDNASNFVWVETFVGGTNNVLESVVHDPIYDRIYVGGKYPDSIKINGAAQPVANGTADIYIARLNDDQSGPNGRPSYDWVKTFNGTDRNYVRAMDVDATGDHLYLTGDFRGDTDFGNGTVSSINIQDLYILKLDASNHAFVRLDHTNSGSGEAIDVDAEDVVYLGGTFLAGTDFNFQPVNAAILVNAGLEDGFTVKYEPCNATTTTETVVACDDFTWIDGNTYTSSTTQPYTPINEVGCDQNFILNLTIINSSSSKVSQTNHRILNALSNDEMLPNRNVSKELTISNTNSSSILEVSKFDKVSIYPNPADGFVTINLQGLSDTDIEVYNMSGQLMKLVRTVNADNYVMEADFPQGIYSVILRSDNDQKQYKLIKR